MSASSTRRPTARPSRSARARRQLPHLAHRSAFASASVDARPGLFGRQSPVVSRWPADRLLPRGNGRKRTQPGALDHEIRRHEPAAGDRAHGVEAAGLDAGRKDGSIQRDEGLVQVDLASGALTPVAGAKARTLFTVDPSGKWIAYQVSEGGPVGIAAIPVAGGSARPIVTAPFEAYHPSFSPPAAGSISSPTTRTSTACRVQPRIGGARRRRRSPTSPDSTSTSRIQRSPPTGRSSTTREDAGLATSLTSYPTALRTPLRM